MHVEKIVDSTYYTQIDMVAHDRTDTRTTAHESTRLGGGPRCEMRLPTSPIYTPYDSVPNKVSLTEITPAAQAFKGRPA